MADLTNGHERNGTKEKKAEKNREKKDLKKSFWERLKNELKVDTQMLPLKAAIFFYVGGCVSFVPYLTLYMREIGLTIREIAIIYAVQPIASLVGPTLSGIVADKTGRYTFVLMVNVALTAIFHSTLLLVPPSLGNNLIFNCRNDSYSLDRAECDRELILKDNSTNLLTLKNCVRTCRESNFPIKICLANTNNSSCINYSTNNKAISINVTISQENSCSNGLEKIVVDDIEFTSITCPGSCAIKCRAESDHFEEMSSSNLTFYLYFALKILGTMNLASAFTMLDAVVLSKVKESKSGFGKQRMMSMLAQAVFPFLSGIFADYFSQGKINIDYSPAFFLGDGMLGMTFFILFFIQFKVESNDEKLLKNLKKLVAKVEVDMYLLILILLGMNWGFLETYLFPYLKELNAPTYLLGLTLTVGSIFGLPFMFWSDYIVQKIGQSTMFFLSFVAYFLRFFGYSYITSPWHCFFFEILEVITYQMMWVAAATYCPILAPANLLATMTGIAGAAHYSMGKGLGSFIGGYLISWLGLRVTFRTLGIASLGGAVLHFCVHKLIFQKKIEARKKAANIAEAAGLMNEKNRNSLVIIEAMKNSSRRNSYAI